MSFIPNSLKNNIDKQIKKKEKPKVFTIVEDPYAEMSDNELEKLSDDINKDTDQLRININNSNDKPLIKIINENEEQYLEDIDTYFNDDEQIELVSNGIKLTTAKEYKIQNHKSPIWHNKITAIFIKWLTEKHPDEIKFLKEENKSKEEIKYISPMEIKQKMKEYQQKQREISDNTKTVKKDTSGLFDTIETKEEKIEEVSDEIIKKTVKKDTSGLFDNAKPEIKKEEIEENYIDADIQEEINIKKSDSQLIIQEQQEIIPIQQFHTKPYPTETEIIFLINRHRFVKEKLLDKNDTIMIKKNKFIKKSGWRKFINAFGISIELIEQKVYEKFDDKHAKIRVRAIAPNGQSVEGIGIKSWSELYEKNMHNLVANAWTRAVNRAVSDLVGYGAVSAEELKKTEGSDLF